MMSHAGSALIDPQVVFKKINLLPGMRVADLGCGRTGHFVFQASKIVGDKGVVYAVEIVKNILESIRSRVQSEGYMNVQAVWSDIEMVGKAPIPSNTLNACFLVNVLFLVKNKTAALQEAARLLMKDGVVVVVDWSQRLGPLGPTPELLLPPERVIDLAGQIGLTLLENAPLGDCHYCLIFKKT